jgi:hypothetical protein
MCCVDISALLTAVKLDSYGSGPSVSYSCLCKKIICLKFLLHLSLTQNSNIFMTFVRTQRRKLFQIILCIPSVPILHNDYAFIYIYAVALLLFLPFLTIYIIFLMFVILIFFIFISSLSQPCILYSFYKNKESSVLSLSFPLSSLTLIILWPLSLILYIFPFLPYINKAHIKYGCLSCVIYNRMTNAWRMLNFMELKRRKISKWLF